MQSPVKRNMRFEPTERFSARKRNLFPSQNDEDSDGLGTICPIESSSSPERYDSPLSSPSRANRYLTSLENQDYDNRKPERFSSLFEHLKTVTSPKRHEVTSSPDTILKCTPNKENTDVVVADSPAGHSPTQGLKTPHENVSNNQTVPKLNRKSIGDSLDKGCCKRKFDSPTKAPASKNPKLDSHSKISKARTALFTENIFPAKSFYPKSENSNMYKKHYYLENDSKNKKASKKSSSLFLCNRRKSHKYGQINAGVRHGIRKPKQKQKLTKAQIMKAAIDILDNSPLNQYLEKINKENAHVNNGLSVEQIQKMDSILKNIDATKAYPKLADNEPSKIPTNTVSSEKSVKRPLSPQPESNKKFFKSHKTTAVVTINRNLKLKYDNGEMSYVEKKNKHRKPKFSDISFDTSDLSFVDETLTDHSFTDLIQCLDDSVETVEPKSAEPLESTIVLTAHNSVTASENSIQLHNAPKPVDIKKINEMLLSPTALMCGLALDSPKGQCVQLPNLTMTSAIKKQISFPDEMAGKEKLFPIFRQPTSEPKDKESQSAKNIKKIWKPIADNQYLIDAGQKRFGATQCPECAVVYQQGEPDDEIMHFNHHNAINVLRFNGWKNEKVVRVVNNGKIIQINPHDSKIWWKKIKDLLDVVNRELGFVESELNTTNSKVFLYILNKQIVGCAVTEPKSAAHKMLPPIDSLECCTEETYPVKCGISRVWVAVTHRRQGIASALMDTVRSNFMFGHILSIDDIAFSSPTEMGKQFATKYTKSDCYLVYTM